MSKPTNRPNVPPKRRLWKMLGYEFLPQGYVLPIFRDGQFYRLVSPGRYSLDGWSEEAGQPISINVRILNARVNDVSSSDGVPFTVELEVPFVFDPRRCAPQSLAGLVQCGDAEIKSLVGYQVADATRTAWGDYSAVELQGGGRRRLLRELIVRWARAKLEPHGIAFLDEMPITIRKVAPPSWFEQIRQTVLAAQAWQQIPVGTNSELFYLEFARRVAESGGSIYLQTPTMLPMLPIIQNSQPHVEIPNGHAQSPSFGNGINRPTARGGVG